MIDNKQKTKVGITLFNTPELQHIDRELVAYANYLVTKTLGKEYTAYDDRFKNAVTFSEWWAHFLTSPTRALLFLPGHPLTRSRMREFYITVLLRAEWHPTEGSDVRRIIEYTRGPRITTFEVRHCSPHTGGKKKRWTAEVTDSNGEFKSDFVTVVMLPNDLNPCYGDLFCFPKAYLSDRCKSDIIYINQNRFHKQRKCPNAHWQYNIENYQEIETYVEEYCNWGEPLFTGLEYDICTDKVNAVQPRLF